MPRLYVNESDVISAYGNIILGSGRKVFELRDNRVVWWPYPAPLSVPYRGSKEKPRRDIFLQFPPEMAPLPSFYYLIARGITASTT
jgi:hypothetical protein